MITWSSGSTVQAICDLIHYDGRPVFRPFMLILNTMSLLPKIHCLRVLILATTVGIAVEKFGVAACAAQDASNSTPKLFQRTGNVQTKKVSESSGVVIGSQHPDSFWTINDSGGEAEVYCLMLDGRLLCELKLDSATNEDWEAMGQFRWKEEPYLLIADVGDNLQNRASCQIYVFPEPEFELKKKKEVKLKQQPQRFDFTYESGPRNCEAVAVDPLTQELWLVEKIYLDSSQKTAPGIFVLPLQDMLAAKSESTQTETSTTAKTNRSDSKLPAVAAPKTMMAKRIADFPVRNVTDMNFSADGQRLIIRNYLNAHLYQRTPDKTWRETVLETKPISIPLPLQMQGEAIGFTADSKSLIVTSELVNQPIWVVDLEAYLKSREKFKSE